MNDKAIGPEWLVRAFDAYGGDVRRWPDDLRAAGEALVASDDSARQRHAAAVALDTLLDLAPVSLPSRALKARILLGAAPRPWRQFLATLWPLGPAWQLAPALILVAVMGFAFGPLVEGIALATDATGDGAAATDIDVLAFGILPDDADVFGDENGDLP